MIPSMDVRYFWNSRGARRGSTEKATATSAESARPFLSWNWNSSLIAFCSFDDWVQV